MFSPLPAAVHGRGYNVPGMTFNVRISNSYENRYWYVKQISGISSLGRFLKALIGRSVAHKLSATGLVDSTNPECAGGPLRGYAPEALLEVRPVWPGPS